MRRLLLSLSIMLMSCAVIPAVALAADPLNGVDCSQSRNSQSAVCTAKDEGQGNDNPIAGPNGLLLKITRIVAFVAGAAALIIMLVGSIKFIISGGDANKASSAKSTIINAMIGIAVIVLSTALITFVVNRI